MKILIIGASGFLGGTVYYKCKKKEHFLKLYSKLQVAKHADLLLGEVLRLEKRFDTPLDFSKKTLEEMKVRIKIYKEIEKDYSERLAIMSSPYYALLEKEDIDGAMP